MVHLKFCNSVARGGLSARGRFLWKARLRYTQSYPRDQMRLRRTTVSIMCRSHAAKRNRHSCTDMIGGLSDFYASRKPSAEQAKTEAPSPVCVGSLPGLDALACALGCLLKPIKAVEPFRCRIKEAASHGRSSNCISPQSRIKRIAWLGPVHFRDICVRDKSCNMQTSISCYTPALRGAQYPLDEATPGRY